MDFNFLSTNVYPPTTAHLTVFSDEEEDQYKVLLWEKKEDKWTNEYSCLSVSVGVLVPGPTPKNTEIPECANHSDKLCSICILITHILCIF
jgi:hypothetical protein